MTGRRYLWGRGGYPQHPSCLHLGAVRRHRSPAAPRTLGTPPAVQDGRTLKPGAAPVPDSTPAPPADKKNDDKKKDDKTNVGGRGGGKG
jgi:hypothetical protein